MTEPENKSECCGNCLFWENEFMIFGFCVHDLEWKVETSRDDKCENFRSTTVRKEKADSQGPMCVICGKPGIHAHKVEDPDT